MNTNKPTPCLGILGWIFGHKFLKSRGGHTYEADTCFRCGSRGGAA